VYVRRVWDDRMQARVAREGELVAALEKIGCERTLTTREGCREAKARGGNLKRSEWCARCAAIEEEGDESCSCYDLHGFSPDPTCSAHHPKKDK
ncbi:hypothetical protein LCGC14_3071050, partial [marine sediment metagenome]